MNQCLNITNGDCAVDAMQKAGINGDFLPWRDVLHDGPVPGELSLKRLSEIRAQFIIDRGWGKAEHVRQSFIERDEALISYDQYDKVILWFEHDLYDQLHLLQILGWLSNNRSKTSHLTLICVDQYLGTMAPEQMATLHKFEEVITDNHFILAQAAWAAFRSNTPEKWLALLQSDTSALPFLSGAIVRLLEEYPACTNGLSRAAFQALDLIRRGESRPDRVFELYQASEERRFLGDSSFWAILNELLASSPPLLTLPNHKKLSLPSKPDQVLSITKTGEEVLNGKRDWLEINKIDKWIGGVHLTSDNTWCWDSATRTLKKQSGSTKH